MGEGRKGSWGMVLAGEEIKWGKKAVVYARLPRKRRGGGFRIKMAGGGNRKTQASHTSWNTKAAEWKLVNHHEKKNVTTSK